MHEARKKSFISIESRAFKANPRPFHLRAHHVHTACEFESMACKQQQFVCAMLRTVWDEADRSFNNIAAVQLIELQAPASKIS